MTRAYETEIQEASTLLANAFLQREDDLDRRILDLDGDVLAIVREMGIAMMSTIFGELATRATNVAKRDGMHLHRQASAVIWTVLGRVTVASPYLRNPRTKENARPVKDGLGLWGRRRTPAVERALVDFGIEDSFELASRRFEEHYGHDVGRTTMLRVVEGCAERAESYVEQRLASERAAFDIPLRERPGVAKMLVELDGCMIRTGSLTTASELGTTEVRQLPRRKREENWREVRVGFARGLDDVEKTYVARMDKYPVVANDLFNAAVASGLSSDTEVFAVSDGGHGLREELDANFSGLTFLLDRPHLKQHLFSTADALGFSGQHRSDWVSDILLLIDEGHVADVIEVMESHQGIGHERTRRLSTYLARFADALDYRQAYEKGFPIGSGEVESAHRYIPQKRLKIAGACWSPRTINPMLALRVLRANGWWQDFWNNEKLSRAA
jgi:hypothetical protein